MKTWLKISTFLWLVVHNNILTQDNLWKRGFIGPSWCHLCGQEEETQNHLLNICPYSSCIWNHNASIMRMSDRNCTILKEIIEGYRSSTFQSPIVNRIRQFLPGFILWNIWKERNGRIFKSITSRWKEVWNTIQTNINENISLQLWTEQDLTPPPNKFHILKAWKINLTPTPEISITVARQNTSHTHWDALPKDWFKLNFDGASKGNSGPAGYGVIIQNGKGEIIHILVGNMGHNTNIVVEIWSLLCGLQAASEKDIFPLIAEGDSQIVINILTHLINGVDPEKISPR